MKAEAWRNLRTYLRCEYAKLYIRRGRRANANKGSAVALLRSSVCEDSRERAIEES